MPDSDLPPPKPYLDYVQDLKALRELLDGFYARLESAIAVEPDGDWLNLVDVYRATLGCPVEGSEAKPKKRKSFRSRNHKISPHQAVLDYLKANPSVALTSFELADGMNEMYPEEDYNPRSVSPVMTAMRRARLVHGTDSSPRFYSLSQAGMEFVTPPGKRLSETVLKELGYAT